MGMPRHIGHSDDDWVELVKAIQDTMIEYRYEDLGLSSGANYISDLMFSVGQKAYMAGYHSAQKEKEEA